MDELLEDEDEYWLHKIEAEVFERVVSEIIADLSARSNPPKTKLPAEYYRHAKSD